MLRPLVFLICQHPFSAKHRSLSLPKQALSKSTHVLINHAKVQRKVHESEDAACPSTLPHAFSVKERLQFVELGAHDEGDSHDPHGAWLAVAACRAQLSTQEKNEEVAAIRAPMRWQRFYARGQRIDFEAQTGIKGVLCSD